MRPWLFHLGPLHIPSYFFLLALGMGAAIYVSLKLAESEGVHLVRFLDLCFWLFVLGMVGARLLHVLADGHFWDYVNLCFFPERLNPPLAQSNCWQSLNLLRGGFAFYGGFLLATPVVVALIRKHQMGVAPMADIFVPGVALGLVFGRLGCFLAGCCYGKLSPVDFPLASVFTDPASLARPLGLRLYPTQLFAAGTNLIIFLFLRLWLWPRRRFQGQVFWAFVALYAVGRFLNEFLRNDSRGSIGDGLLSTSQLIGIPLALVSVGVLVYLHRRSHNPGSLGPQATVSGG